MPNIPIKFTRPSVSTQTNQPISNRAQNTDNVANNTIKPHDGIQNTDQQPKGVDNEAKIKELTRGLEAISVILKDDRENKDLLDRKEKLTQDLRKLTSNSNNAGWVKPTRTRTDSNIPNNNSAETTKKTYLDKLKQDSEQLNDKLTILNKELKGASPFSSTARALESEVKNLEKKLVHIGMSIEGEENAIKAKQGLLDELFADVKEEKVEVKEEKVEVKDEKVEVKESKASSYGLKLLDNNFKNIQSSYAKEIELRFVDKKIPEANVKHAKIVEETAAMMGNLKAFADANIKSNFNVEKNFAISIEKLINSNVTFTTKSSYQKYEHAFKGKDSYESQEFLKLAIRDKNSLSAMIKDFDKTLSACPQKTKTLEILKTIASNQEQISKLEQNINTSQAEATKSTDKSGVNKLRKMTGL